MSRKIITPLSIAIVACFISCNGQTSNKRAATQPSADSTRQGSSARHDLPEPYATKSSHNFSKVLGWENNTTPMAPAGFKVQRFGEGYNNPRWVYILPNGDVLVAEVKREAKGVKKVVSAVSGMSKSQGESENQNRITLLRDKDNDGRPELRETFVSGLNLPFGMVLVKDQFFVACEDGVWSFPYKEGETSIKAAGKKIMSLPQGGRHWTRNITASKDGRKLYVSIGSASDVAEDGIEKENRRACILEINPDGSNERIFASGLRNPVGMDWAPGTGALWTAVNERDELGDDLVPDYITSVKEDGFYGWPYSYFGQHPEPRIKEKEQRPDLVQKAIVPDVEVGSHTASLGFIFYTKRTFPTKYADGAFVGQHGSWNRSVPSGYKVLFVPFKDGKPSGPPEDFLTGFMANRDKNEVYGRPVGVAVTAKGALLVADDAGNSIWRVSYEP